MDCTRIKTLIPLFVEGDLSEAEAENTRAHLRLCADCKTLTSEFEASQEWIRRGEPDFDEKFLTDFKRAVLQDIHLSSRARKQYWPHAGFFNNWLVPAFSVAGLLLIGMIAFYTIGKKDQLDVAVDQQQATKPADKEGDSKKPADNHVSEDILPAPRLPEPPRIRHARAKKSVAAAPRQPRTEIVSSRVEYFKDDPASQQFIRTEVQTRDPKIRIIWLHRKESDEPLSGPSTDF